MNSDDPSDYKELNISLDTLTVCEFVSIPPNFQIESHLSYRENFEMFKFEGISLDILKIISSSIANSVVFATVNNANMDPKNVFYLMQVFSEIGVIVNSIDNPFRRYNNDKIYDRFAKHWSSEKYTNVRGQEVKRINFIIFNLFHMFTNDIYEETMKNAKEIMERQIKIDTA